MLGKQLLWREEQNVVRTGRRFSPLGSWRRYLGTWPQHTSRTCPFCTQDLEGPCQQFLGQGSVGLEYTSLQVPAEKVPELEGGQVSNHNWNFVKQITFSAPREAQVLKALLNKGQPRQISLLKLQGARDPPGDLVTMWILIQ